MATRDIGVFIKDIRSKAPKLFPAIGLFHVLVFLLMLLLNWGVKITDYYMEVVWLLAFTVSWLYTCDLRRWAAVSYIVLTMANTGLFLYFYYAVDNDFRRDALMGTYVSTLWLPALLFSFLVLFHFRRFNQ
ncbi:MAG: hypothetical protein JNL72_12680 [Flavipsychrobacter sp.]|nr:hypothetical protein [Flavipsychrobacter sp.]